MAATVALRLPLLEFHGEHTHVVERARRVGCEIEYALLMHSDLIAILQSDIILGGGLVSIDGYEYKFTDAEIVSEVAAGSGLVRVVIRSHYKDP